MSDLEAAIFTAAELHEGRYLLPQRFGRGNPKVDQEYEACEALCAKGVAEWITFPSTFAPGIRLSGKPFDKSQSL